MTCVATSAQQGSLVVRGKRSLVADARGVPLSVSDPSTVGRFETALHQFQTYVGDPVATLDEALEIDPDFILGHAFRATVLVTFTERRFTEKARVSVASAEALLGNANDRERTLVAAARRLVDGDWEGACHALDDVLVDHPRDAFALQAAHLMDSFEATRKTFEIG